MRSATTAPATISDAPARAAGMSPELLERFAALLHEQQALLFERAARLGVDIEQLQTLTATNGQGETEHATSDVERAVAEVLEADTLTALEEIAFALARIDEGSYGLCAECGVPIGAERLAAVPETKQCVTCRQARDRGGR
jgi:RNA polymerase-binding transcription factor DksA